LTAKVNLRASEPNAHQAARTGLDPPGAIVAYGAALGKGVRIEPWCSVGASVVIGGGARLVSHVVVDRHTAIGRDVVLFPFCTVGLEPHDLKYQGEPTRCENRRAAPRSASTARSIAAPSPGAASRGSARIA
jgi:UDP-N-acetylglucosamine acyltransferase